MPRPLGYTLPGGENTTKGGRGLGDILTVNTSSPGGSMDSLSNDLPPYFSASDIAALNGPSVLGGADFTSNSQTMSNMVSSLAGSGANSGPSMLVIAGVVLFGVLMLVKK